MTLKQDIKSKKLIFGSRNVIKRIKNGSLKKVYVSSNYPSKNELNNLCTSMNADCKHLMENSAELGVLCKKGFAVSLLGVE